MEYTFEFLIEQVIRWKLQLHWPNEECSADRLIHEQHVQCLQDPLKWLTKYLNDRIRIEDKNKNYSTRVRSSDCVIYYIILKFAPEEFIMEWKMRGWEPVNVDEIKKNHSFIYEGFAKFINDPYFGENFCRKIF